MNKLIQALHKLKACIFVSSEDTEKVAQKAECRRMRKVLRYSDTEQCHMRKEVSGHDESKY
jgi:hypothetical protein